MFRRRAWGHLLILVACSFSALAVTLLLERPWSKSPSRLEPIELWTVDRRFTLRPPLPVSDDPAPVSRQDKSKTLVMIDYDDQAARKYGLGRWPWDRRVHARLIELLKQAGARAILLDITFELPAPNPEEDRSLVETTKRAGIVYYPVVFTEIQREALSGEVFRFEAQRHLLQAEVQGFGAIPVVGEAILPMPGLIANAKGLGHIQRTSLGGTLRRVPLLFATKGGFVPALSMIAALHEMDADLGSISIERSREIRVTRRTGERIAIPIDRQGRTWINYAGPWGERFQHYPYSWLLDLVQSEDGKAKALALFKDKTVLVANLTTGSSDVTATPFEHDFPTSEVHLHLLSMLTRGQFLRNATPLETVLCFIVPLALVTAATFRGGHVLIISTFVVVFGAYLFLVQHAFNQAVILPAVAPLLTLGLGLVLLLMARVFLLDAERRRFQSALGACLPPQTIKIIKDSPNRVAELLAGRSRELTVLFADIKDFSGFCKRADPLHIQRVLRDYLTAMTVILRDHGGTLDKYMGDGIMAFFGDAEPQEGGQAAEEARVEHHAANAVRAALAMQQKMAELNVVWQQEAAEPHQIRIGINTGQMTVGNLGTEYLWDYTVVGPEVNKAQRLEAVADPGGLMVSKRTYHLARKQDALPGGLPSRAATLKGMGEEAEVYSVPPDLVSQLSTGR